MKSEVRFRYDLIPILNMKTMFKTIVSKKDQVVIPKTIRDMLGLTTGAVLEISVEKRRAFSN